MKKLSKLHFGTAGIPLCAKPRNTANGIKTVKELGLSAMELEFVHSVNISKEKAPTIKKTAEENDVVLTCHGQYYINLNAKEKEKRSASRGRIVNAAKRAHECGAWSICFHPAFYLGMDAEKVYKTVKEQLKKTLDQLDNIPIWVRPETTGKPKQFGDLHELLKLSAEFGKVMPTIDFSHLHARSNGKYNTKEEFRQVLVDVEKFLGKKGLNNMHIHLSGIAYGEKGEKNHLVMKESDMKYSALLKTLKEFKVKGVLICESPNIEEDALLFKKTFARL